jgi:hypothetical protein
MPHECFERVSRVPRERRRGGRMDA